MKIDPTLRIDLLAKVRAVEFEGVNRNLFQFTERQKVIAPPPKEDVDEAQKRLAAAAASNTESKPQSPQPPRAPRISWRYYGFANGPRDTHKRAFLLDGEEVLIATEGDVFKNRYKIVSIGVNSIVIEDMQFSDQQTLPLEQG